MYIYWNWKKAFKGMVKITILSVTLAIKYNSLDTLNNAFTESLMCFFPLKNPS